MGADTEFHILAPQCGDLAIAQTGLCSDEEQHPITSSSWSDPARPRAPLPLPR